MIGNNFFIIFVVMLFSIIPEERVFSIDTHAVNLNTTGRDVPHELISFTCTSCNAEKSCV